MDDRILKAFDDEIGYLRDRLVKLEKSRAHYVELMQVQSRENTVGTDLRNVTLSLSQETAVINRAVISGWKQLGSVARRGSNNQVVYDRVLKVLETFEEPVSTADLLRSLRAANIEIGGKDPRNTLSAMLSTSPLFQSNGRAGWTLRTDNPSHRNAPSEAKPDVEEEFEGFAEPDEPAEVRTERVGISNEHRVAPPLANMAPDGRGPLAPKN
ncbi:hypothetical protein Msil_2573 [Methylocella silvestris BL2]|uniref:Uncharacterized protein n=1 Tax=Methylocella silvestris (strain DSM 15510 / CIP 108128 / LMG 27833 / NCIMB 13906 / BL2) TaxID=395965 RepID=B8EQ06_METSB|nr:hypothetical protein [Methylocella silvestris]ACK51496.1 hypothetical protein Msil_2573 [Methylocella silvestris BL2]